MAELTKKLVTMQRVNASGSAEVFYPKTVAEQVYIDAAGTKTLADHITDTDNIHLSAAERTLLSNKGAANGVAVLDSKGFIPSSNLNPSVLAITTEFANITALLANEAATADKKDVVAGQLVMVVDASTDPTVGEGWAIYRKKATAENDYAQLVDWQKIAEKESLDVTVTWENIEGAPESEPDDIDDAVDKAHEHDNAEVLNALAEETNGTLTYTTKTTGDTDEHKGTKETIAFMSKVPTIAVVEDSADGINYSQYKEGDLIFVVATTPTSIKPDPEDEEEEQGGAGDGQDGDEANKQD